MLKESTILELTKELDEAKREHDRLSLVASKALHTFAEARAPILDDIEKAFVESKHMLDDQRRYVKRLSKLLKQHRRMMNREVKYDK